MADVDRVSITGEKEYTVVPADEKEPTEKQMALMEIAIGNLINDREKEYRLFMRCGKVVMMPIRRGKEEAA